MELTQGPPRTVSSHIPAGSRKSQVERKENSEPAEPF